jgi:serine/threonine protein kinase
MPQTNQRISEYVLDAKVGGGTFGEVWRARHHVWTDQLVAIKIPTDPQYVRNLQREGVAIHGLLHPNIVRAMGFDPYSDPPYLVMEYVPGTNLRKVIQQRPSIDDAVKIMRQVLAGLAHAHAQGVVHRDIKPENILIHERAAREGYDAQGLVKITDFGLGRAATTAALGSIAYSASLNDAAGREIAGTLDYMSPEQRSGADAAAQTDIYACGVVLYELLTGERPAGTDLPSDLNQKVPKHLDEAFKHSYARIDKRFASANDFARALEAPKAPASIPSPAIPTARRATGAKITCPDCNGRGQRADAEWGFCDFCHGRGRLTSRVVGSQQEIEMDCPHCRGRGTKPPERCARCHGTGKIDSPYAPLAPALSSCPSCRKPVEAIDQFCMHCGVQLVAQVRRCPRCGAYPDASDRFCIFCGEGLPAQQTALT